MTMNAKRPILPSKKDLQRARRVFNENETRDLFYRAALDLVDRSFHKKSELNLAEAVAVLLQTWNATYYRFSENFDDKHMRKIERLMIKNEGLLKSSRKKDITCFNIEKDKPVILNLFKRFETVLGPVGASKCLHLLAPKYFPLWDRSIAAKYGFPLQTRGTNNDRYFRFMLIIKEQCEHISRFKGINRPIKAIDEYNYCKFVKKWI